MKAKPSLFRYAAFNILLGLLIFQLISGAAVFLNMMLPLAKRSADDLASLLIWSGKVWLQSAPQQQPEFSRDLLENHGLSIKRIDQFQDRQAGIYPYATYLRNALQARIPTDVQGVKVFEKDHHSFEVEFVLQDQLLQFSFEKSHLIPKPGMAAIWAVIAGVLITMTVAWLLAKRITAPIKRLGQAAGQIGSGEEIRELPESNVAELAELTQMFNLMHEQLQAKQENQKTLLSGISHDLRSPLARLKMALALIPEQQSSLVVRMEKDVAEMDCLIGAQLELARAQEKEIEQLTDLGKLLAELVDGIEAQFPGRVQLNQNIDITLSLANLALRRCLDNLIHNALRYAEESQVEVTVKHYSQAICIGVRDRGPGIDPQLLNLVVRPFYRIESSRNRSTGGSGLGLAITRQLAKTQGWRFKLVPRYDGGLSAWILIPG